MALYNTGTLIVSGGSGAAGQTDSFGALKSSAATEFGAEGQDFYLGLAGKGILKGIDVVNMRHLFRFGSEQQAAVSLTADDDTYSIASDTFAVQEVQLIDSSGDVDRTLEYVPWGQFNSLEPKQNASGAPEFWTARNSFDDLVIHVYPVPDAQAAANYDIKITNYVRIARPTLDSDVIVAPRELGEVLVAYAVYFMHRVRSKSKPYMISESKQRYDELLAQFVHSTEREPTENLQWTLAPFDGGFPRGYDPLS
jgi:hypothetical protein